MIRNPFSLFDHLQKEVQIDFFTKEDHIGSDQDLIDEGRYQALASLNQVHGARVVIVNKPTSRTEEADALITEIPGLSLSIRAADCQNFVIFDPEHKVLGVIHAGWRGLLAGVIPAFFETLHRKFHSKATDVYVAAGPSLCMRCSGFTDPATELPGIDPKYFSGKLVDLRGIAFQQFLDAGVRPENFERHSDCTRCMSDLYFSYRGGDQEVVKSGLSNSLVCSLR